MGDSGFDRPLSPLPDYGYDCDADADADGDDDAGVGGGYEPAAADDGDRGAERLPHPPAGLRDDDDGDGGDGRNVRCARRCDGPKLHRPGADGLAARGNGDNDEMSRPGGAAGWNLAYGRGCVGGR